VGKFVGGVSQAILKRYANIAINLSTKFEMSIINKIMQLSEQKISNYIGQQVDKGLLKGFREFCEENLLDKPLSVSLTMIDQKFGTKLTDLYVAVKTGTSLSGPKLDALVAQEVGTVTKGALNTGLQQGVKTTATLAKKQSDLLQQVASNKGNIGAAILKSVGK
jgi:hypothetical protein